MDGAPDRSLVEIEITNVQVSMCHLSAPLRRGYKIPRQKRIDKIAAPPSIGAVCGKVRKMGMMGQKTPFPSHLLPSKPISSHSYVYQRVSLFWWLTGGSSSSYVHHSTMERGLYAIWERERWKWGPYSPLWSTGATRMLSECSLDPRYREAGVVEVQ